MSELLERIRPAGSPGAPTEGERSQARERRENEIAELIRMLQGFEAEAAAVVSTAERRAIEIRRKADAKARHIRADLPRRLASAQSPGGRLDEHASMSERNRVAAQSEVEIERLRAAAGERIPALVDAAVNLIWSSFAVETKIED